MVASLSVMRAAADRGAAAAAPAAPQNFAGAERIVGSLGSDLLPEVTVADLQKGRIVQDDRIELTVTDDAVYFHIPGQ